MVAVIIAEVCGHQYDLYERIISKERSAYVAQRRWLCSYLITYRLGFSLHVVGRLLNRDHSTIRHGLKQVERSYYLYKQVTMLFKKLAVMGI